MHYKSGFSSGFCSGKTNKIWIHRILKFGSWLFRLCLSSSSRLIYFSKFGLSHRLTTYAQTHKTYSLWEINMRTWPMLHTFMYLFHCPYNFGVRFSFKPTEYAAAVASVAAAAIQSFYVIITYIIGTVVRVCMSAQRSCTTYVCAHSCAKRLKRLTCHLIISTPHFVHFGYFPFCLPNETALPSKFQIKFNCKLVTHAAAVSY